MFKPKKFCYIYTQNNTVYTLAVLFIIVSTISFVFIIIFFIHPLHSSIERGVGVQGLRTVWNNQSFYSPGVKCYGCESVFFEVGISIRLILTNFFGGRIRIRNQIRINSTRIRNHVRYTQNKEKL